MKRKQWTITHVLAAACAIAAAAGGQSKDDTGKKTTGGAKNTTARTSAKAKAAHRPTGKRRAAPQPARGRGPGLLVSAEGLRPDSNRLYAVYKGNVCVRPTVPMGQRFGLPPGEYDVRIGFPSGWVSRKQTVPPGQTVTVQTGLLRFRHVTPASLACTVPQKLYHGQTYLATGYQGQTARLYAGTYTVRYHLPGDGKAAQRIGPWRVIGPFPLRWKNRQPVDTVWPPEKTPGDTSKPCVVNKKKLTWHTMAGGRAMKLDPAPYGMGVFYLAAELAGEGARNVELAITCRGSLKAWLNGQLIQHVPYDRRMYQARRIGAFAELGKGRNVLMVKVMASTRAGWPVGVLMERWRRYDVAVGDGRTPAGTTGPAGIEAPQKVTLPPPIPGIEGVVFVQVPNLPNGRSGLHGEQFRIVRRPQRSRVCTLIPAAPDGRLTDLTGKHFAAAINPDLSYDARKVIFSARRTNKPGDPWNIYEMNVDGTGLRQVTRGIRDCFDPYYLPNGKIVFSCTKDGFRDEYDRDYPPLLHTCNPDGSDLEKISFNLSSDTHSIVLRDGRVLFTSWQHHGDHESEAGNFSLCTILPDGTSFNLFAGNELRRDRMSRTMGYAQQLADGRVVFVETGGHRLYNTGSLTAVHPRKPLSTREILTPGILYNGHNLAGRYASPYPLPDGGMLVSYSPGRCTALLPGDPAEDPRLGIYLFDFDAGRPGRLVFDDPTCQDYDALAIHPRPLPPIVPRMVVPGKKTGIMFCVNAYLSDRPRQNNRVVVGQLPPAEPDEIKGVRVVEGFGVEDTDPSRHRFTVIDMLQMTFGSNSNSGNNFEQKRIVGYAPAEPDGSFNVEVPADTVLSLQTLDARGMAIETQLTWTWVRPGETRMCVGCHEDREMALPNHDCLAMHRPAHLVAPAPEERRTVDFRRDIMPIIEQNCSGCHKAKDPAGGLDLRKGFELVFHRAGHRGRKINAALFNHAYESLLQAPPSRVGTLVVSGAAKYSPLVWRLYGRKLAFSDSRNPYKKQCKQMPPGKPLSDAEKKLFVEWIDIGAQWDNLRGDDDLPGYDAAHSRKLAVEANKLVARPILEPEKAFTARCLECHDTRKLSSMQTMPHSKMPALLRRMAAKRKGWIKDQEIPLILRHIYEICPKGKGK